MFCIVEGCTNEVTSDYPACVKCAKVKHFTNRHDCHHCTAMREAERQTEPVLRAWELQIVYGDDAPTVERSRMTEQTKQTVEPSLRLIETESKPEIIITPSARGYRFTLPEWCAPSPGLVRDLKSQTFIGYHAAYMGRDAYRLFPAAKLAQVIEMLNYWYAEQDPRGIVGRNRNGGQLCAVRVSEAQTQNAAETVRWNNEQYVEAAKKAGGVLVVKMEAA
jgi:hypothetical protein